MKFTSIGAALCTFVLSAGVAAASTVSLSVEADSSPYLAGMPVGTTGPADGRDDVPTNAPPQVTGLSFLAGDILTFSATGLANQGGGNASVGPDGNGGTIFSHSAGAANGMSNVTAPVIALLGVFLSDAQPDTNSAPDALNFGSSGARDFSSLSPDLQQVFFIGDGLDLSGDAQEFVVPTGATRLFLGTMDLFGWFNNEGSFDVNVTNTSSLTPPVTPVPLPAGAVLLMSALGLLVFGRRWT